MAQHKHLRVAPRGQVTLAILAAIIVTPALSVEAENRREYKDLVFARVNGGELRLDLYLPDVTAPSLLVWVHGGAWRSGSKEQVPPEFVSAGFATASVEYRLSGQARFPAQVHDIKAAIRFLRAVAPRYGYSADSVAIAGSSAGGHLAALVGVSNGHSELEGSVGDHLDQPSAVQAIVDYYGPTNLMTILSQSTPHGLSVRVPALDMLLGGQPETRLEVAKLASPVTHVDSNDPPLLIFHGDQDPQVPINQSHELQGAYKRYGVEVHLEVIHGGAHGGKVFFAPEHVSTVSTFLQRVLRR